MSSAINSSAPSRACAWCGVPVEPDQGFRLVEPAGERRAAFCRLEHIVPWAMQGPHWEPGAPDEPLERLDRCAHCDAALRDTRLELVRHRGEHRVPDAFCSVDHLAAWARSGGRWR